MPPSARNRTLASTLAAVAVLVIGGGSAAWADVASPPLTVAVLVALALGAAGSVWLALRSWPFASDGLVEYIAARGPGAVPSRRPARPMGPRGPIVDRVWALAETLEQSVMKQRRARQRAERDERLETEFLSTVSHELRTPLNAILGFSQVLLDEMDGPLTEDQREDVETIHQSGTHLSELVDDVLDLARIESGLFTLQRTRVEVGPILRDVGRLLEAQRRDRPVAIELEVDPATPAADADPKRLRQIAMNLATNALKFTDQGSVVITAGPTGDGVGITVRDTGAGIPKDQIDAIFEEFTQVRSVKRKGQGTGLGLAICKRLVDLHGGRIDVDSVVGQGSTFAVVLPAWSEA